MIMYIHFITLQQQDNGILTHTCFTAALRAAMMPNVQVAKKWAEQDFGNIQEREQVMLRVSSLQRRFRQCSALQCVCACVFVIGFRKSPLFRRAKPL